LIQCAPVVAVSSTVVFLGCINYMFMSMSNVWMYFHFNAPAPRCGRKFNFNSQSECLSPDLDFWTSTFHHNHITTITNLSFLHLHVGKSGDLTSALATQGSACACRRHGRQPPCPQLHLTGHSTRLVGSFCRTNRPGAISCMSSPATSPLQVGAIFSSHLPISL